MTAGRGIIHEEFHSTKFSASGGVLEMCQLWLNLPAKDKMVKPRYQPILKDMVTTSPLYYYCKPGEGDSCEAAPLGDGELRVIAGEFKGVKGPAMTFTQVDVWDISLKDKVGKTYEFDTVAGNNLIVFCRSGTIHILESEENGGKEKRMGPQDGEYNNINTILDLFG